jgi:lipid II:glycine glycyltransferase (peptidoglycan interpeptide bridge formation enzyme)
MSNISASDGDYIVEVDQVRKEEWDTIVKSFRDALINQTWAWGEILYGAKQISHLVLKRQSTIVAAAQVRVLRIPFSRIGFSSVKWGPMWKPFKGYKDLSDFRAMVRALKQEYAEKRGLCLRVVPYKTCQQDEGIYSVLLEEEFRLCHYRGDYGTLLLDLTPPMEELRKRLRRQWRQNLDKAVRCGLTVVEGESDDFFAIFCSLYREMQTRKKFASRSIEDYMTIQRNLENTLKMKVMICHYNGEPLAALVVSHIGDVPIALFAATGNKGLELKASFLLWWKMIESLRASGALQFDLCGIDPRRYPGIYQFKSGLAGIGGVEKVLEEYLFCTNPLSASFDQFLCLGMNILNEAKYRITKLERRAASRKRII